MNTNIQIFKNSQFGEVRVVEIDGQTYFAGKDVALILGYSNTNDAIISHVDEEDRLVVQLSDIQEGRETLPPHMKGSKIGLINESGVYSLVFGSELDSAKKFKKWISNEVLPSIRKHGAYLTPEKTEELLMNPDMIIQLATSLKNERAEKERYRIESEMQSMELKESAPKVEYYDKVLGSKGYLTVNMIAAGLGISHIKLNKLLLEWQIQYKQSDTYFLYQQYRDKGYAVHRPYPYTDSSGMVQTKQHLYWTESGKKFIIELYNRKTAA